MSTNVNSRHVGLMSVPILILLSLDARAGWHTDAMQVLLSTALGLTNVESAHDMHVFCAAPGLAKQKISMFMCGAWWVDGSIE